MGLTGIFRAVGVFGALVVTSAACTGMPGGSGTGEFTRYENAVASSPARYPVPSLLVPFGGCVLGMDGGTYQGAMPVTTNWVGEGACTRLTLEGSSWSDRLRATPVSGGDGLAVYAAVPRADGAIIGVGVFVGQPLDGTTVPMGGVFLVRRDTDGSVHPMAALPYRGYDPLPPSLGYGPGNHGARFSGLIRIGRRLLVTGSGQVNGQTVPVVWESTDGGATVRQIPLPPGPLSPPSTSWSNPTLLASAGQTMVASPPYPLWTWRSLDDGRTWTVHPLPVHGDLRVLSLVRSQGRWLLLLTGPGPTDFNPDIPSPPLALSSTDGERWTVVPGPDRGHVQIVAATSDHDGELVLVGKVDRYDTQIHTGPGKAVSMVSCAVAWTGPIDALRRHDLGCGRDSVPVSVTTLEDGRVLIVGNHDLWIRN